MFFDFFKDKLLKLNAKVKITNVVMKSLYFEFK